MCQGRSLPVAETEKKPGKRNAYKPEYAERLIEHMSKGFSFATFSAEIGHPKSTIRGWLKNREFQRAYEIARAKSQYHWERVSLLALQGGLRKIKSEKILRSIQRDANGRDVRDSQGKVIVTEETIEREYETIPLRDSMWIFTMKAQFGWRDDQTDEWDPDEPSRTRTPEGEKASTVKQFLLAYNLKDQPYVVKDRDISKKEENTDTSQQNAESQEIKGMETQPV